MDTKNTTPLPEILEYEDFRSFLKDWYKARKEQNSKMSFRYLSLRSGLKSTNYWKLIMEGKRNLSLPMITRFAQTLQLDSVRSHYFHHLVRMNQSSSIDEKTFHARYVIKLKAEVETQNIPRTPMSLYDKWYYPMLREALNLNFFREDPHWISELFYSSSEAADGLEALEKSGIAARDEKGRLRAKDVIISTGHKTHSALATSQLKQMIIESTKALEFFGSNEREFTGLTLSLDEDAYSKSRELVKRFIKDILQIASDTNVPTPNRIYQLNLQLFPLSETTKENQL